MQALRLARTSAFRPALVAQRRCLTTATVNHVDTPASASSARVVPIPLSNVEAQWERLTSDEKVAVHDQLELLQQKDWKELSLDEKKTSAYTIFSCYLTFLLRRRKWWCRVSYSSFMFVLNSLFRGIWAPWSQNPYKPARRWTQDPPRGHWSPWCHRCPSSACQEFRYVFHRLCLLRCWRCSFG